MFSRIGVFAALIFCAVGCSKGGETLPATHPAKGTLAMNGKPVKDGFVQFTPVDNQDYMITGDVDAVGNFELVTIKRDKKMKGAPPGTYTVTYNPPGDGQAVRPISAPTKYTIEAKENVLSVQLSDKK